MDNNLKQNRQFVASLIREVLTYKICVREAILQFPADSQDTSIIAAYHALVHFEADEDLRHRDALYKEEQDDYLEFISHILERGEDLPDNIIRGYNEFYETVNIPPKNDVKGFWKSFFRFLSK